MNASAQNAPHEIQLPRWKRPLDLFGAIVAALLSLPILALVVLAIWLQDRRNPFYVSERVGRFGKPFRLVKIRSMVVGASANAVDTTIAGDPRVTRLGWIIRLLKLDELPQFWHVIRGEMSLVGPRPNVPRETVLYTRLEQRLLLVSPGITDYSSIVFSDLADVLAAASDANIAYNQLVRPWKSRLGLHYVQTVSLMLDVKLICFTLTALVARNWTLERISRELRASGAPEPLQRLVLRRDALSPTAPPGADEVVSSRQPTHGAS